MPSWQALKGEGGIWAPKSARGARISPSPSLLVSAPNLLPMVLVLHHQSLAFACVRKTKRQRRRQHPHHFLPVIVIFPINLTKTAWRLTVWELKQRRFCATHFNRKWGLLPFSMPWRWQICIAKFLFSYKEDLPESFNQNTAQWFKKSTCSWRPSLKNTVAMSRRCLVCDLPTMIASTLCKKITTLRWRIARILQGPSFSLRSEQGFWT